MIGIDALTPFWLRPRPAWASRIFFESIIERPAWLHPDAPFKALLIDSWSDNYVGVVMLVRVIDGVLRTKDKILLMATGSSHLCEQVGVFTPKAIQRDCLSAGQVVTSFPASRAQSGAGSAYPDAGRRSCCRGLARLQGNQVKQVFAGLYPVESNQYDALRESLEKLRLNDSSLLTNRVSQALGFGFRCGFLAVAIWKSCRNVWSANSIRI